MRGPGRARRRSRRDELAAIRDEGGLRGRAHRRDRARRLNHDVIAFLTNMAEHIGRRVEVGPLRHDLLRPRRHGAVLPDDAGASTSSSTTSAGSARSASAARSSSRDTLCVGRTHGIHAEPMTFGMKFGAWAWALQARRAAPARAPARTRAPWGAISGAVGSYSQHRPVRRAVRLREARPAARTRSRRRSSRATATRTSSRCSRPWPPPPRRSPPRSARCRSPTRSRPRSRSPRARRAPRRCRTSATRSPPSASCGLARVVKANAQVGFDDVALWHERDISHSSAERVVLADSYDRARLPARQARVDPRRARASIPSDMRANLEATRGLIYSSTRAARAGRRRASPARTRTRSCSATR